MEPRWHRHLEGWQLGVVAVGIALGAAVLALPRAVAPRELPLPAVDRAEERRAEDQEERWVAQAVARPLPFLVRAVGEAFRRFGAAEARRDAVSADALGADLLARVAAARKRYGDEPLLELRAVQSDLFLHAIAHFGGDEEQVREVNELGGAFSKVATESGWILENRRSTIPPDGLAALFTVRWTKLAGLLPTYPFSPSLNEWRLYYRTLITHPEKREAVGESAPSTEAEVVQQYVHALAKLDPDYPALLAQGILAHWMNDYQSAAELFRAHLVRHPTGPWRLRAQNYLLAARRQVPTLW